MEYQGWVNPYGASIAHTIALSSDAAAHAAEMTAQAQSQAALIHGQAWARSAEAIGSLPQQLQDTQARDAMVKLRQEQLQESIDARKQRQEAERLRLQHQAVTTVGKVMQGARSPEDALAAIDSVSGMLPADTVAHVKDQIVQAGPEGFGNLKAQHMWLAKQFAENVKLGENDRLVSSFDNSETVGAVPKPIAARPGDRLLQPSTTPGAPAIDVGGAPFAPGTGRTVSDGQVVDLGSGATVGAPVPLREKPSEVAESNARVDKINKEIEVLDNQLAGTMPISDKDKAELAIQRARLDIERTHYQTIANGQDINAPKNQERLEESYRTLLKTTQSSRSGGMGLEDKKVDQAKHLIALLDQTRASNGTYNLTPTQQAELSMGLATLISPTGVPSDSARAEINAATAKGDFAKLATYVTGQPVTGTPQAIAELLRDSIERQGVTAEKNREGHFNQLRAFAPTDLSADRRAKLEQGLIGANRLSVSLEVPGVSRPLTFDTQREADKFLAELKARKK